MSGEIKENVTRRGIWLRLCFMIIMIVAFSMAEIIVFAVVAFQFLSSLITARTNDQLIRFGRNLARYIQQIVAYLTFATEDIPYPFMNWPDEPHEVGHHEEAHHEEALAEEDSNPPNEPAEAAGEVIEEDVAREADIVETPVTAESDEPEKPSEASGEEPQPEKPIDTITPETKTAETTQTAVFADGGAYQKFMGERSRLGGQQFVKLLDLPARLSWLDVGCGTGAFSAVILEDCDPSALIGIDSSEQQVAVAQTELGNAFASFRVSDATRLPFEVDSFDVAVSSYVLNYVPEKQRMMDEMARVVRPEGMVAVSVFDHAGGRMSTHPVWELIGKRDPAYREAEFEKRGWNITHPDALKAFFENAGLEDVTLDSIEIDESFTDFDEYWNSMTGSLPTSGMNLFLDALDQAGREEFKDELKSLVRAEPDGTIKAKSGSWVVRGKVPA